MHAIYFGHPEEEVPFTKIDLEFTKVALWNLGFLANRIFRACWSFAASSLLYFEQACSAEECCFEISNLKTVQLFGGFFFPNCGAQSQVLSFANLYTAPSKQNSVIHDHLNIVYSPNLPWPAVHFAIWWCESTPLSGGIYTTNTSQNCPENSKIVIENSTWIGLDSVHFRTP